MKVGVVVNPVAGGGRMAFLLPVMRAELARHFADIEIAETRARGEGAGIAARFAREGKTLVIAAGGDGTVSETVEGLLRAGVHGLPPPELGIIPVGTGSDLARSLGIGRNGDLPGIIRRIATATAAPVDAGRVSFLTHEGEPSIRHFINIASLGVSGAIDRAVNAVKGGPRSVIPGKLVFLLHTVRELIRYRFDRVRITVDDGAPIEATVALVACANGRFFGGGMMIAPDAAIDDGQLDVVVVRGISKLKLLADLRLLYSGAHRNAASCIFLRGRKIVVEPLDGMTALLDIDGEAPGRVPATFEVLPNAIMLRL